jgi:hypothetical protein
MPGMSELKTTQSTTPEGGKVALCYVMLYGCAKAGANHALQRMPTKARGVPPAF